MSETKKSESFDPTQSCDNKPTETIRKNTLSLETLLKEIYSNHRETIKLCREEQKDKFTKIVSLKNKMFERGKEIQKECNMLKKENQDLKETLSSRNDVPCKNCDHLRRSFDSLEEAYKRSLDEKEKMIKYLEAQLNGQHPSFNSDPDCVSPKSSPDQQKNNRLKLKSLKKRVIYKESTEQHPIQVLPLNISSNSKPAPLLNVPETCLPDTCPADDAAEAAATSKNKAELDNELTVVPDTLALFNPWDSDGETDQNLSKIPEEIIEKSLVLESPFNKADASINATLVGAANVKLPKNLSVHKEIEPNPKTLSSDKNISIQSKNGNLVSALPQSSLKMDDSSKNVKTHNIQQFDLGGHFHSPTKSPLRKKRKQITNEIPKCDLGHINKDGDPKMETSRKEETVLPLRAFPDNGQIVEQSSFKVEKSSRRCRSRENQNKENCEIDCDQTLPPENWGNETLMNDTEVEDSEKLIGDDHIWHTAHSPVSAVEHMNVSPHKTEQPMTLINGSLAPSMQMTQFLVENEFSEDPRNRKGDLSKNPKDKTITEIVEVESSSQTFPSRSYKFGAVKSPNFQEAVEDLVAAEPTKETLCDSFDLVPQNEEKITYAYHSVVRKKDERQRLNGYTCRECVEYYQSKGLSKDEIRQQVGKCSRHRAKYEPPATPDHFWSVGFPDTMECERRGYLHRDEPNSPVQPRRRRRLRQLNTRQEEEKKTKTETDEQIGMTQMLEYLSAEED